MIDIIPWIICVFLTLVIGVLLRYVIKFGSLIIDIEDSLSTSLEIMDKAYYEMSLVVETPVVVDSPEVKQVLFQLKRARDSVLLVSNTLAEPYGGILDVEEETETNG